MAALYHSRRERVSARHATGETLSAAPLRGVPTLSSDMRFNGTHGRGGTPTMLDYTLVSRSHLQPILAESRVIHARAAPASRE